MHARPLLRELRFIDNEEAWGVCFRRGLFEIPDRDLQWIRTGMACQ